MCSADLNLRQKKPKNSILIMEQTMNEPIKSKRELLVARLSDKYPDKDFSADDDFYGQIYDDFDQYDKDLADYKERESRIEKAVSVDPRSASFMADWMQGVDPVVGLIRSFGDDFKAALDDEKLQEQIAEANKDYLKRLAEEKELEDEYEKNIEETNKCLDALVADGTMQEKDADDVVAFLFKIVHDGIVGKFSPETLHMALKAIKHDADVAEAEADGETRGRNAKIEERLRKGKKGDGMAQLDGGGGAKGGGGMKNLGVLDNYGDSNKDIWERGGVRRISGRG